MEPTMKHEGNTVSDPKWPEIIKQKRLELGESQATFGARFGVTYNAVSAWELGKSEPPGEVTWWLVQEGAVNEATQK